MGLLKKDRVKEYDPDTPGPLKQLMDRIPNDPASLLHVSVSISLDELIEFGKALQEARKRVADKEFEKKGEKSEPHE
jgi:hypothetical protein